MHPTPHREQRRALAKRNLPGVARLARHLRRRQLTTMDLDDLISAGVVGMMEAVWRCDLRRSAQADSYVLCRARGAILDALRANDWTPRNTRQQARQLQHTRQQLRGRLGRDPHPGEVAHAMGMSTERLRRVEARCAPQQLVSLQALGDPGDQPALERLFASPTPDPEAQLANRELLMAAIARLEPRDRQLLRLLYFEAHSQQEVSRRLNVSESRVCQLHRRALERLRKHGTILLRAGGSACGG